MSQPTPPSRPVAAACSDEALRAELTGLAALNMHNLRTRWRRLTRKPAPEHLGRALLLRLVAYKLQTQVHGDLDRDTIRYLAEVHRQQVQQRRAGQRRSVPDVPAVPDARKGQLKPGTLLVREHGGRVHRVMVLAEGFAFEGATYASLSEIARAITGTSWNGPRFFGLRARRTSRSGTGSAETSEVAGSAAVRAEEVSA